MKTGVKIGIAFTAAFVLWGVYERMMGQGIGDQVLLALVFGIWTMRVANKDA